MNTLLTKLASVKTNAKQQINWVEVNIPYNLKDTCRIKFKGQLRFDGDISSWVADETIANNFDKVYLEQYPNPSKEQKLVLKQSGCNYCKERKLYYMLKFQTEENDDEDV
jgi:hypothetical protein